MALNLSTLTSSATSGDVLAEMLTTADFLEPVPLLKNLARGSNKGGNAKQGTALNQPKALPLVNGKGYLYLSGVSGNYASLPHESSFNLTDQLEIVARIKYDSYTGADAQCIVSKWSSGDFAFRVATDGDLQAYFKDSANGIYGFNSPDALSAIGISGGDTIWVKATIDATSTTSRVNFYASKDDVENEASVSWTALGAEVTATSAGGILSASDSVVFGAVSVAGNDDLATGAVLKANYKAAIGGTPVLDVDFTATNVRHNDTKFKCASGQTVTINQAGNDPATVIKKSVLRFSNTGSTNIALSGLLNQTIDGGYMFVAFSVIGDGADSFGRILGLNATGGIDSGAGGVAFRRNGTTTGLMMRYNQANITTHSDFFDDERGDYLVEAKVSTGSQKSKVNNADLITASVSGNLNAAEFSVASFTDGTLNNAAIDLEFLALFPATITDAQAADVVKYINKRNTVFDLKDGYGYYFYDGAKSPASAISAGSASWNGRIVGSDNGDADKFGTQSTNADQPVGDGYKVTFADNTDFVTIPSTAQAGWQIVGTSLGTFAYRVRNEAQTEFSLLGYVGNASYRKAGDLYGVMLLPESATGAEIEAARKLLIDRGASDAAANDCAASWFQRDDILEFGSVDLSAATSVDYAWFNATQLVKFSPTDISNCTNFTSAWQNCTALTSFSADAKLGTAAANVNFSSAWQTCTSLTSFPLLDTSSGTGFYRAWQACSSLTSFPLLDLSSGTNFAGAWAYSTGLTSFPPIDTSAGTNFAEAWYGCTGLTSFPLIDTSAGTSFGYAWYNCTGLTSFPGLDASKGTNFSNAWRGCTALTDFSGDAKLGTSASNVNFTGAFRSCGLTSFPVIDTSNGATFYTAFYNYQGTTFPVLDFTNGTNFGYGWATSTNLTAVPVGTTFPSGTTFVAAWESCTSLVDFPAGAFDTLGTPQDNCFAGAWFLCTSLSAQSVDNILDSIHASGKSAPSTGPNIAISYDTGTGTPDYLTAAALTTKGWNIVANSVVITTAT